MPRCEAKRHLAVGKRMGSYTPLLIRAAVEAGAEWAEVRKVYPVSFTTMSAWLHKGDEQAEAEHVPVKRRRVKKES